MRTHTWTEPNRWALIAALALVIPAPSVAQQNFSLEARGGVAVPASDLSDLLDVGPTFGLGFAYNLSSRIALRIDGDVDVLSGVEADGAGPAAPDMNIFHYNAGLAASLVDPLRSSWNIDINLGGGASTFDSDSFQVGGTARDFSQTYFTANGGLRVGYDVSSNVNVFLGGQAYLMFTDEAETAVFAQLRSDIDPNGFDTAWTFPLTAGVALRF